MNSNEKNQTLNRLVDQLDLIVREQVGESLADTMQRIRQLALERRAGLPAAESRLVNELERLDNMELRAVIRWLSMFFDLANVAEDRQRISVLKQRDETARAKAVPRSESIASAIVQLCQQGLTAGEMQRWLDRLQIEPVFTAHPSEAKRRTTRQLLRRVRQLLPELSTGDADAAENELLANLTVLWQSDLVRPNRPPVMSEVSRGVYFASTLWNVVPQIYRELRSALDATYPHHHFELPRFLSFGTWIGGDRDGHPFVTAEISRKTFARLSRAALEGHLAECRRLHNQVVMSDRQVSSAQALRDRLDQCCANTPELADRIEPISKLEIYRRFVRLLEFRLEQTLAAIELDKRSGGEFESLAEFRNDVELLRQSMLENRGKRIVDQFLQPWLDLIDTFGFHFAALDIRQNSEVHRQCLEEVVSLQSAAEVFSTKAELIDFLSQPVPPTAVDLDLSEQGEVFDTFLLLADQHAAGGTQSIGAYVISMTHSEADVLTVLWLWRRAWALRHGQSAEVPHLPIVPLFETIDDLRNAGGILDELLSNSHYREYLADGNQLSQMVMVGYSDSTKDGGYLTAGWELHQAQERLATIAEKHHVELTVFHGRGGALGRGGGPAARAIRSLPRNAVNGRLRVTEQGEVLSERYDDPFIAHRHLEQIINATLIVSATPRRTPDQEWIEAMNYLSTESLRSYRELVEHAGFLNYFDRATPISEIETLPIGSRPARRGQRRSISGLRAIPWTFAWTQSRHILPAWYGLGSAVRSYIDAHDQDWSTLKAMYTEWPMYRALIDNAELALAKADMGIARLYAALVGDEASNQVWRLISSEFNASRAAILLIKENDELLEDVAWLRASVSARNPYVDPLNLSQIALLRRSRSEDSGDGITELVRLSIQGIAAGLRTTG